MKKASDRSPAGGREIKKAILLFQGMFKNVPTV